jgi:hypothetical protein
MTLLTTNDSQESSPNVSGEQDPPSTGVRIRKVVSPRTTGRKINSGMTEDHGVRYFHIESNNTLYEMRKELDEYRNVLLGRKEPPIDKGVISLMEVADAYHARAREMEQLIHRGEADGHILRGSKLYKFRTGELRSFIELVEGASALGSRRITAAQIETQMREWG